MNRLSRLMKNSVQGRNWVFVASAQGKYQRWRKYISVVLMALLFITPWLRINELPLILLDIPHRKFILFGTIFWPQDIWLLFFLGVAAGVTLFLATAWGGRIWCGYACPQSVFTEQVFFRIEQWLEGNRNQQMRIAKHPLTFRIAATKVFKHILFLLFSSLVGHTFVAYFVGGPELIYAILHPSSSYNTALIFTSSFTLLFYLDFAYFREQVCNYMCPYARFQSALLDEDSLVVGYDEKRGEPRGKKNAHNSGDCIDCRRCVHVCPQGIDIREGLQMECIHCARCADACDEVMVKVNRQPGLIRYDSELGFAGSSSRLLRPRTVIYLVILVVLYGAFLIGLDRRSLVDATLLRQPGSPFVEAAQGQIINRFTITLANKDTSIRHMFVTVEGLPNVELVALANPIIVPAGKLSNSNAFLLELSRPAGAGDASAFSLQVTSSEAGFTPVTLQGQFLRPAR